MNQKTYISLDAVGVPAGSSVGKATVEIICEVKPRMHLQKPEGKMYRHRPSLKLPKKD